ELYGGPAGIHEGHGDEDDRPSGASLVRLRPGSVAARLGRLATQIVHHRSSRRSGVDTASRSGLESGDDHESGGDLESGRDGAGLDDAALSSDYLRSCDLRGLGAVLGPGNEGMLEL